MKERERERERERSEIEKRKRKGSKMDREQRKKSGEKERFKSRWHPEKKRQVDIESLLPLFPSSSHSPPFSPPLLFSSFLFSPPCSFPPSLAAPMWGMQDACLRLQMSGPHNANLISLAVWVATSPRKERKGEERRGQERKGQERKKTSKKNKTIKEMCTDINNKTGRLEGERESIVPPLQPFTEGGC